jgi:hypothetical protein
MRLVGAYFADLLVLAGVSSAGVLVVLEASALSAASSLAALELVSLAAPDDAAADGEALVDGVVDAFGVGVEWGVECVVAGAFASVAFAADSARAGAAARRTAAATPVESIFRVIECLPFGPTLAGPG